jgi:hypothetical protein
MFKWIQRQLNYKIKYEELLRQKDDAACAALHYMALYDGLCASLPHDHDKSTAFYWREHADKRLRSENDALKRSLDAQTERLDEMLSLWTEAHVKYGWSQPPKRKK